MKKPDDLFPRCSGILLHLTSLPGPHGIGDLGEAAYRFVDWLEQAGQSVWQFLPLGPTGFGDSPYQTFSAFAGNPLLISLDQLVQENWLCTEDLADAPDFPADRVDYGRVITYKNEKLSLASANFAQGKNAAQQDEFESWCRQQRHWLDDYILFIALKDHNSGKPWTAWPSDLAGRDAAARERATADYAEQLAGVSFQQWVFHRQWHALKEYANARGIRLFGDLPIFVAHDSCDVWARSELFRLDEEGQPAVMAGVPPDYFSKSGQLWGNPLYDWARMREEEYRWWVDRMRAVLDLVDVVRIDHFRGFEAYWEVPAGETTAENGRWVAGPGAEFFQTLWDRLGILPIIAEDLGVITAGVAQLRDEFQLPGMKILQFAWSDPANPYLPHEYGRNCVVYTGTHDNAPTLSWWESETDDTIRRLVTDYLGREIHEPHWDLIRLGMMSVAHTFVATMQDILGLGDEARMNQPGAGTGNWTWRLDAGALNDNAVRERLTHLTWLYRRRPDQEPTILAIDRGGIDHADQDRDRPGDRNQIVHSDR